MGGGGGAGGGWAGAPCGSPRPTGACHTPAWAPPACSSPPSRAGASARAAYRSFPLLSSWLLPPRCSSSSAALGQRQDGRGVSEPPCGRRLCANAAWRPLACAAAPRAGSSVTGEGSDRLICARAARCTFPMPSATGRPTLAGLLHVPLTTLVDLVHCHDRYQSCGVGQGGLLSRQHPNDRHSRVQPSLDQNLADMDRLERQVSSRALVPGPGSEAGPGRPLTFQPLCWHYASAGRRPARAAGPGGAAPERARGPGRRPPHRPASTCGGRAATAALPARGGAPG